MATINLNSNDIRRMINETMDILLEKKEEWFQLQKNEPLCRFPYFVFMDLSSHAMERKIERGITRQNLFDNLQAVVRNIIDDFEKGILDPMKRFLVVNKETCLVIVTSINTGNSGGKKIKKLIPITAFIWDGRVNLNGKVYYEGEESPAYIEAKEWNEENQEAVMGYKDWKHAISYRQGVKDQHMKANRDYYHMTHPQGKSHENVMKRLNTAYGAQYRADRKARYDALPVGDLYAIHKFDSDFDKKHIDMEPLE